MPRHVYRYIDRMPSQLKHTPTYRHVARVYDLLATAYSLGAIDRAKRTHHHIIKPGDQVLYAGAGRGKEIAQACQHGAEVTCVEPCPAMALRLHDRLAPYGDRYTIMPRAIQAIAPQIEFDIVVAHFFLNVFDHAAMPGVLEHLCRFVKPGGRLVIADFKPNHTSTGGLKRLMRAAYYRPLNLAGWLLRICALHPIYDYEPLLIEHGFAIESRQAFRTMPGLPVMYDVLTAQRKNNPHLATGVIS